MSFGRYKIDENTLNNYDDKRVSIFFWKNANKSLFAWL